MALKRLSKEYTLLRTDPPQHCIVSPVDEDLFHWKGGFKGPDDGPYKGGFFEVDLVISADYPFKPPKVKFITKVYHPNIDEDGSICLDILKQDHWKPSTKLANVMEALRMLLEHPNPDDALVSSIAEVYKSNRDKFNETAKQYVSKYAMKS
ncbi:ubiquitin-conjugating enzyme E2D 2 [Cunninghamella echinulata]|nr:ubiquitin-conjugating enzyme E2D 2 [Cunninghamella echinulata]